MLRQPVLLRLERGTAIGEGTQHGALAHCQIGPPVSDRIDVDMTGACDPNTP